MPDLTTPIYFKTSPGDGVRADPCYYVLSASGLYIGRNTEFFQSLVPARRWPVELETQDSKLQLRYPVLDGNQLAAVAVRGTGRAAGVWVVGHHLDHATSVSAQLALHDSPAASNNWSARKAGESS